MSVRICAGGLRNLAGMAKKQMVSFVDDLDGHELDIDDVHTVSWAWSGVEYQVDVSGANLDKIENGRVPVAKLLEVSTRVGGRRHSSGPKISGAARGGAPVREIREWAHEAGFEVPARGRLPQHILDAYAAAH